MGEGRQRERNKIMPKCRSGAPHVLGDFWKLMLLTSLQSTGAAFVEAFHSGRKVHFLLIVGLFCCMNTR